MSIPSLRTSSYFRRIRYNFVKISWKYEPGNILSCHSTCLHGASCILKCIDVVQMPPIQYKWCKYFWGFVMRVCGPVYPNSLVPHTASVSNPQKSQTSSSFLSEMLICTHKVDSLWIYKDRKRHKGDGGWKREKNIPTTTVSFSLLVCPQ